MDLEEKLNYEAYHHQYKEGDILYLKDFKKLENIDQILLEVFESFDDLNQTTWYLNKEKQEQLKDKKLKVVSTISWHLGLPFYVLEDLENDGFVFHLAEFYLHK